MVVRKKQTGATGPRLFVYISYGPYKEVDMRALSSALCLVLLFSMAGCSWNKPWTTDDEKIASTGNTIVKITTTASAYGLQELNKKNPDVAKQVAAQIPKYVDEVVVPYLNNQQGVLATAVDAALIQNFVKKLPPEATVYIEGLAVILDQYIPAPEPGQVLSKDKIVFLQSFFVGLKQGSLKFTAGQTVTGAPMAVRAQKGWLRAPPVAEAVPAPK